MNNIISAEHINTEHRMARQSAESAVEHAIRCGQLLADVKAALPHGQFGKWIETNCEFSPQTARLYMKAATQNANGLAFSSVRHLFPSGQPEEPQHQREPEPLPVDGQDVTGWLPPAEHVAIARIPEGVMIAWESREHAGFFHLTRWWLDGDDGGSVDYTRRPVALRRHPGFPNLRLFDHDVARLAWTYTRELTPEAVIKFIPGARA